MGASRIGEEQDGVKTAKAPGTRGGGLSGGRYRTWTDDLFRV